MFNLGPGEIIVILLVALLVFGPRKLPELGRSLGAGIREFRRGTSGLKEELEQSLREEPVSRPAPATVVAQAVVPPITAASAAAPQQEVAVPAAAPADEPTVQNPNEPQR